MVVSCSGLREAGCVDLVGGSGIVRDRGLNDEWEGEVRDSEIEGGAYDFEGVVSRRGSNTFF